MDGWMDGWMYKVGRDRRGLGSGGVRGLVVVFGGGCGGDWGGDEGWWRRVVEEVGEVVFFLRKLFGLNYTAHISI